MTPHSSSSVVTIDSRADSLHKGVGMTQRIRVAAPAPRFGAAFATLIALASLAAGCSRSSTTPSAAAAGRTFASPEAAAQALYDAAKADDSQAVVAIVGPSAKEFLLSGSDAEDKAGFATFTGAYDRMHRFGKLKGGGRVLIIGYKNYPFPFPLKKDSAGQWYFDADAGRAEFLARRIGGNELTTIDVLIAMADAEAEYYNTARDGTQQYAQKFVSAEGKEDGLYWKAAPGEPESPLGPLAARANAEGWAPNAQGPTPFHGYFFHILTQQGANAAGGARSYIVNGKMTGGFAFLAFPAEYRNTGVMSFLIDQDGQVFEKDLGPQTAEVAKSITAFDTDASWTPIQYPSLQGEEPPQT